MDAVYRLTALAQAHAAPDDELHAQGVAEVVGVDIEASLSFYKLLGFRVERRGPGGHLDQEVVAGLRGRPRALGAYREPSVVGSEPPGHARTLREGDE